MEPVSSHRADNRRRLRQSLIAAARTLTIADGWDSVRMADVAAAAGVSRQTLYNEFDTKTGLAEAMAATEIESFVAIVRRDLFRHGADVRSAARDAVLDVLIEAGRNPLVRAILTTGHGDDGLLPYLTTDGRAVVSGAGAVVLEWAETFLPEIDAAVREQAADVMVRLTLSHLMLPAASPEETAEILADLLVRLLP